MCDREQEILDAVHAGRLEGRWGEEIRQHIAACADCADLALVADALLRESEEPIEAHLPTAQFLWWKSKLRARREAEAAAMQPVRIAERVAMGAAGAGVAGLLWWAWPTSRIPLQEMWQM